MAGGTTAGLAVPGRPPVNPLTYRQLNRIFHLAAEAAEIRKGATLHTLRHSFATHLLESELDIRMIQALLGHKRLDTTAHYTRVTTDLISKVVSPLDQLGKNGKKDEPPKYPRPSCPVQLWRLRTSSATTAPLGVRPIVAT